MNAEKKKLRKTDRQITEIGSLVYRQVASYADVLRAWRSSLERLRWRLISISDHRELSYSWSELFGRGVMMSRATCDRIHLHNVTPALILIHTSDREKCLKKEFASFDPKCQCKVLYYWGVSVSSDSNRHKKSRERHWKHMVSNLLSPFLASINIWDHKVKTSVFYEAFLPIAITWIKPRGGVTNSIPGDPGADSASNSSNCPPVEWYAD